jgi:hypothetical protein
MTSQMTNRSEGGGLTSCGGLHLERTRDCEGGSETAWCDNYRWRGRPGQAVVVEGVKRGK